MTHSDYILRRVDQRFKNNLNFFNSKIKQTLSRLNSKVYFSDITVVNLENNNRDIELFCYIKNLPDCGSKDKPLQEIVKLPSHRLSHSVFITAILTLDTNSEKLSIIKYNTEVKYCEFIKPATPTSLKGIIGFHYDFDDKEQPNHPIFHAQQNNKCGNRIFIEEKYKSFRSNHTCELDLEGPSQLKYIRIPTPQMDIFSTVIAVLADYIVHPTAEQHKDLFRNLLRDIHPYILPFNFNEFGRINNDFKQNKSTVSYWYPNF